MFRARTVAPFAVLACSAAFAACEPASPTVVAPPVPLAAAATTAPGDACQSDIPDCEAACAMREAHRTTNLDWFDRRCAAVVLGRNPDKTIGVEPAPSADAGRLECDPPYAIREDGIKRWKRECLQ